MTRGLGGRSPAVARRNKAPAEIMDLVENMPDQEFGGPQDVQRAYGDSE